MAGLYFPGEGFQWEEHNGIARAVVPEGQMDFADMDSALIWLRKTPGHVPKVWSNKGLVVWFEKDQKRKTLGFDLIQITIKKKHPDNLMGAQDSKIVIERQSKPNP